MNKYFIRYQFGGGKQPKDNITVEAKSIPDAYKKARLALPKNITNNNQFVFYDCVLLQNEPDSSLKNNIMEVVTFQSQVYQDLISKLDAINTRLNAKEKEPKEKWLDNQELMLMLKISKRTAQHYRDSGLISFSQVGNKIYYRLSDVEELLESHYKISNRVYGSGIYKK